jgi:hypothetical protein
MDAATLAMGLTVAMPATTPEQVSAKAALYAQNAVNIPQEQLDLLTQQTLAAMTREQLEGMILPAMAAQMGIPAEMHIMAGERHCFMFEPTDGTPASVWKDRVWEWTQKMDITTGHPPVWGWRDPLAGRRLEDVADFTPGVWTRSNRGILTAEEDKALWLKGDFSDFILDFEYRLDPGANSGVIIYASDVKNWIPNSVEIQLLDDHADKWKKDAPRLKNGAIYGHAGPAKTSVKESGKWNSMTIWAFGDRVKVVVNGTVTVDEDLSRYTSAKTNPDGTPIPPWLSRPLADIPKRGAIGFQGRHGGARPYLRNLRLKTAR